MSNFVNLQINGAPLLMYSMIGVTTAVLAYATAGGGISDLASKAVGALSPNALMNTATGSVESLGNLNPFSSEKKDAETPSTESDTIVDADKDTSIPSPEVAEAESESAMNAEDPSSLEVETGEDEGENKEATGGKRLKKKSKKSRKTRKHKHSKKHVDKGSKSNKSKKSTTR